MDSDRWFDLFCAVLMVAVGITATLLGIGWWTL